MVAVTVGYLSLQAGEVRQEGSQLRLPLDLGQQDLPPHPSGESVKGTHCFIRC